MTKIRKDTSKWIKLIGIGMILIAVVGFIIWQLIDRNKEIQQIESKLGFEITVVDRQSHGPLRAMARTYIVKPLDEDKKNNIEYILYLNEKNKIEQWAMIKNGKVIRPIITEE